MGSISECKGDSHIPREISIKRWRKVDNNSIIYHSPKNGGHLSQVHEVIL